jgi:multidrug efflux pump subunit AcrA (membrane-fusion protein)
VKNKMKPLILILLAIVAIGGGYWPYRQNLNLLVQLQQRLGILNEAQAREMQTVSGYIEANEINLAAETSGRIIRITVEEGDLIQRDQILVELDSALLEADVRQAEARIVTAKAQLAKIKAGVRAEEIARAEAAVAVAEAAAEAAYTRWQDAIQLRDNPQELDRQIDAARTAVELAKLRISYSVPLKDAGEAMHELGQHNWVYAHEPHRFCVKHPITGKNICVTRTLPEGEKRAAGTAWNYAGADMWEAWTNLNDAVAKQGDAETVLNDLLRLRNDPQEAQIEVAQAEAAYKTALAELEVAKAGLEILKAGPRAEQIVVAEAQVRQAEASLRALNVQRDKHTLLAPLAGWVVEQSAHEGEMAVPDVTVFVDTFPHTPFTGYITYISDQAEFTPKNIQTREERTTTVFAVKIKLENEDQRLKPGMPADAILLAGPSS